MLAEHRLLLLTHDGEPLRVIEEVLNLDYVRSLNDLGWFELIVPGDYPKSLLQPDNLIEFWRRPDIHQKNGFLPLQSAIPGVDRFRRRRIQTLIISKCGA